MAQSPGEEPSKARPVSMGHGWNSFQDKGPEITYSYIGAFDLPPSARWALKGTLSPAPPFLMHFQSCRLHKSVANPNG